VLQETLSVCPCHLLDRQTLIGISIMIAADTITVPTKEMQLCGTMASLGDDVYAEQSTNALEAHIARLTGKEAGLFLPSGTMSNQVALRAHLRQPPYSVLFDKRSHICLYESSGTAFHSGAAQIAVMPENGWSSLRTLLNEERE
jgi:threonine aldolase